MEPSTVGRVGDVLRKNCSRSNLSFDGCNANLKCPGEAVPDDALDKRAPVRTRCYYVGPHSFCEHPARAFLGQAERDSRSFHGTSRFVRDLYSYRTAVLRSSRTDRTLAFESSNMQK